MNDLPEKAHSTFVDVNRDSVVAYCLAVTTAAFAFALFTGYGSATGGFLDETKLAIGAFVAGWIVAFCVAFFPYFVSVAAAHTLKISHWSYFVGGASITSALFWVWFENEKYYLQHCPNYLVGGSLAGLVCWLYLRRKNAMRSTYSPSLNNHGKSAQKYILALILIPVALIAIGVEGYQINNNKCSYTNIDALPSPSGNFSIVRAEKHCTGDEDIAPIMFALLHSGEKVSKGSVFLTSEDYDSTVSPLSIFPKWIDDHNLLIAAPEGSSLKTMRTEFDGLHIHSAYYPTDSDKTKDENLRRQVEKRVHFKPEFSIDHGFGGISGVGCNLTVSAHDGEYLDELELHMTARTTFPVNAMKFNGEKWNKVLEEAYSQYDYQIYDLDAVERPDKHATGADVVGFAPKDGRSKLEMSDFNYPRQRAPSGVPMIKWGFGYNPKDPHDIENITEKIKVGAFAVRVGYWLDNEVVVYSGEKPDDQKPIEMFEQCINQNHIFDTPRHRTNHYSGITTPRPK